MSNLIFNISAIESGDPLLTYAKMLTRLKKGEIMSFTSPWFILVLAGLLEVCWAIGLKYTQGFTRLNPSIFTALTLSGSMYLLARASKTLPIGTTYSVWVGIGTLGATILGILLFNESASFQRLLFLGLLLIAIIGLKVTSH